MEGFDLLPTASWCLSRQGIHNTAKHRMGLGVSSCEEGTQEDEFQQCLVPPASGTLAAHARQLAFVGPAGAPAGGPDPPSPNTEGRA